MRSPLPLSIALGAFLVASGCTVVKPIVGVVMGPILLVDELGTSKSGSGVGPVRYGATMLAGLIAGPIAGLFTGLVSDWNVVSGDVSFDNAGRHFDDPFRTNVDPLRGRTPGGELRELEPPKVEDPPGFDRKR